MCWNPPCKVWRYQIMPGLKVGKGAWQSRDEPGATSSSVPCLSLACSQAAGVADRHAALEFSISDNSFILQDFSSRHGTFVNSCQVQNATVRVRPGDILSFGTSGASFELVLDGIGLPRFPRTAVRAQGIVYSNSQEPVRKVTPFRYDVIPARRPRVAAMVQLGSRLLRGRGGHVVIRFALGGCTNRPFFRIVAANSRRARDGKYLEQLGCLDPLPNAHGEKVAGLNLERLRYWLGCGAQLSRPAEKLLGLAGFLPLHPMTVTGAERLRQRRQRDQQPEPPPADGSAESRSGTAP